MFFRRRYSYPSLSIDLNDVTIEVSHAATVPNTCIYDTTYSRTYTTMLTPGGSLKIARTGQGYTGPVYLYEVLLPKST